MTGSAWKDFWNRGGWWKAVLAAGAYVSIYLLMGWLIDFVPGAPEGLDSVLSSPLSVFLGVALAPLLGAVVLLAFAHSVGWLPRPLFGRQPVRGPAWMWIGPALVAIAAIGHFIGTDYTPYSVATVLVIVLLLGVGVGVSEELITRGIAVTLLRRAGYKEWAVMALSSLIFALLHLTNIFSGMALSTVLVTVLYTFGFGVNMYLAMRVGGSLIWPIVLHAITDPSTFLASGGIDNAVTTTVNTPLLIATIATFAYDAFGVVGLIAVRGHAHGRAEADEPARFGDAKPAT